MTSTRDITGPLQVNRRAEVLSLSDALTLGEERWESLRTQRREASTFSGWNWHDAWCATAPAGDRSSAFAVAAFNQTGTVDALLPLTTRQVTFRRTTATALTWAIGDLGCPDHLDALVSNSQAANDVAGVLSSIDWDIIQLDGIADGATGVKLLQAALEARGVVTMLRPIWPCPFIALPRSWDAYLAERSPSRRHVIQRRERVLARHGGLAVTFYEGDAIDEGWQHLLALHAHRWNNDGAFNPRLDALHRHFARSLSRTGDTWLSTIDIDGVPISAWYGFADRGSLHFYQAGRSSDWSKYSVGGVHVGFMIQRAIARGLERFDFLRGDEAYKEEWASARRWTYQLIAFRPSARGRLLRFADRVGAARERFTTRDGHREKPT